jgi:solute carrier family 39 (zinc transporter), member 1/2/3
MSLHIYAIIGIPLIFILSLLGSGLPPICTRFFPKFKLTETVVFRFLNGFAGGVIIGVGFIHSFPDASSSLDEAVANGDMPDYAWAGMFALFGALVTFAVEMLLSMYLRCISRPKAEGKGKGKGKGKASTGDIEMKPTCCDLAHADDDSINTTNNSKSGDAKASSCDPHAEDSGSDSSIIDDDTEASETHKREVRTKFLTEMLVLLAGLSFHSVFVGFTLGLTENDLGLFLAIIAHQFFEGIALGTRIARTKIKHSLVVLLLDFLFSISAPVGIAIGWGVSTSINNNPRVYTIVDGVFNAISSGILLYVGLTHMIAEEMERPDVVRKIRMKIAIFLGVVAGSAVMAVIGIWA